MLKRTHIIGGHQAAITVNPARDYTWTLWASKEALTGTANSPEEAIEQMEAIVSPAKVK